MIIEFQPACPDRIVRSLKDALKDWSFFKHICFKLKEDSFEIVISKLGTSRILFSVSESDECTRFTQKSEKISLAHGLIEPIFRAKILDAVRRIDGCIVS